MAARPIPHSMTATAFTLEGYRATRTLGVVRGVTVRSRSIFGTFGATLQTLAGGNISLFTNLCEKTRAEAFDLMIEHAQELGATAVTGVHLGAVYASHAASNSRTKYDATEVMQGVTEVLCYGTAIVADRV